MTNRRNLLTNIVPFLFLAACLLLPTSCKHKTPADNRPVITVSIELKKALAVESVQEGASSDALLQAKEEAERAKAEAEAARAEAEAALAEAKRLREEAAKKTEELKEETHE